MCGRRVLQGGICPASLRRYGISLARKRARGRCEVCQPPPLRTLLPHGTFLRELAVSAFAPKGGQSPADTVPCQPRLRLLLPHGIFLTSCFRFRAKWYLTRTLRVLGAEASRAVISPTGCLSRTAYFLSEARCFRFRAKSQPARIVLLVIRSVFLPVH